MKSWSLPKDVKQQILEMNEDGLTITSIWKYFNRDCFPIAWSTIQNLVHPEARRASRKKYHDKNKEKLYKQHAVYYKNNSERLNKKGAAYQKKRYHEDPEFRERVLATSRRCQEKKKLSPQV